MIDEVETHNQPHGELDRLRRRVVELESRLSTDHHGPGPTAVNELRAHQAVLAELAESELLGRRDFLAFVRQATESAARTLNVERVSVWLFDEARTRLQCIDLFESSENRHTWGAELEAASYPHYFAALSHGRGVAADDARSDPSTSEFAEGYLKPLGITSMLDAPIRRGEVLHGVVCHEHVGEPIEWGGDAIQFAASVADFVALALESRERRRAESLTVGQNRVLELLAKGRGLGEVLDALILTVEEHGDGMLCSVLVLDESGCRLRHAAAPNLPDAYNQAVDGLTIGPSVGSCGTAAYRGQRVIVEDIATDPLWADYREIAVEHNLGACWSEPILSADGTVLGTFAIYYQQARRPSDTDLQTISSAAHLAGVAIENKRAEAMERKHREYVEAELRKVKQQLVNQTRLATVGQVAASISHELRNPLGAVNNAVYYLRRHLPHGEAKWEEYLNIIDHEVHVADGIITDLLEMSRAKEPHKLDSDLGEVLDAARRSVPGADGVQWDVQLTPDPFVVRADSGQLRQVLTNLINNAVQAMEGKGQIRIRASHDGGEDTITIEDSGPGVSAEDAARIFEPLFTTKAKGTGLGLAICRQIAKRHGGQVELVETPQPGATFRLRLPRDTT